MAYQKTAWQNDSAPAINAENLNKIEEGIYEAHQNVSALDVALSDANARIDSAEAGEEALSAEIAGVRTDISEIDKALEHTAEELEIRLKQPFIPNEGAKTLTDSDDGYMRELKIDGATEQKQYSGKNMLDATLQTTTLNGVTFTNNGDGTYTLNGTASAHTYPILGRVSVEIGKKYRLTGCPIGGSNSTFYEFIADGTLYPSDTGNGLGYTIVNTNSIQIGIGIKQGVVCNNLVFKPMLTTDLSATYADYEPFVGCQPSPSPTYPQKIDSVGSHMGCVDLGSLTWNRRTDLSKPLFEATLVGYRKSADLVMVCPDYEWCGIATSGAEASQKTLNKGMTAYNGYSESTNLIFIRDDDFTDAQSFKQAMNGVKLAYELAEGATPEKYAVVMEVENCNLINKDKWVKRTSATVSGTAENINITISTSDAVGFVIPIESGAIYHYSVEFGNHAPANMRLYYDGIGANDTRYVPIIESIQPNTKYSGTFTVAETRDAYLRFWLANYTDFEIDNLIITKGADEIPYVPHTSQSHILAPPYPLNGIGDVKDYADAERGVWVYNTHRYTTSAVSIVGGSNKYVEAPFHALTSAQNEDIYADKFIATGNYTIPTRIQYNGARTGFVVASENDFSDKIEIVYPLETPQIYPMSAEDAEFLRDLRTYYPSTNIVVTDGKFDVDTTFLYKLRLESYIKKVTGQITDTRKTIDNIEARQIDVEAMTALAYINSEYASALAELN